MSIIHAQCTINATSAAEEEAGSVTLSGEAFINNGTTTGGTVGKAGIRVYADGTIRKRTDQDSGTTITQIDSSTDWIIPNGDASSSYEFYLDVTSGTVDEGDSSSTWIGVEDGSVTATYLEWLVTQSTSGSKSFNWTLRCRFNGGSELDNAAYSGSASHL